MQGSRQPTISDVHLFYTKKRLFFKNMPLNFDFIWNPDIRHSMQGTPHISWGNGRTVGGLNAYHEDRVDFFQRKKRLVPGEKILFKKKNCLPLRI